MSTRAVLVFVVVGLLAPTWAWGSRYSSRTNSIDWIVATSDLIVRGFIIRWEPLNESQPPYAPLWLRVTVRVTETLKGEPSDEVEFLAWRDDGTGSDGVPPQGEDLLLGLRRAERFEPWYPPSMSKWMPQREKWDAVRSRPKFFLPGTQATVPPGRNPVFFVVLRERQGWWTSTIDWDAGDVRFTQRREEVLSAARQGVAHPPAEPFRQATWLADWAPDHHWHYPTSWVTAVFPCDARIEAAARRWALSDDPAVRQRAVAFLTNFKSAATIDLLKRLLDDPFHVDDREWPYPVRVQAHRALSDWNVAVPPRVLVAPVIVTRSVSWVGVVFVAAVFTALVLLCVPRVRGRAAVVIAAGFCCLLLSLRVRAIGTVDCLMLGAGSDRMEVSSWAGEVHFLYRRHAPARSFLAYGSAARRPDLDQEWSEPIWSSGNRHGFFWFRFESGLCGQWGGCELLTLPMWALLLA